MLTSTSWLLSATTPNRCTSRIHFLPAKNKFTLSLDEDLDLETETLKENLQTMCEGSFFEEIEESLIQGLHQS